MLAEDTSLLGRRQQSYSWLSKQCELYGPGASPCLQGPTEMTWSDLVDTVRTLGLHHHQATLSLGTPFYNELQANCPTCGPEGATLSLLYWTVKILFAAVGD